MVSEDPFALLINNLLAYLSFTSYVLEELINKIDSDGSGEIFMIEAL